MADKHFEPRQKLLDLIKQQGGWVNAHSHIDRAYILNSQNFDLIGAPLQEKWDFPDEFKRKATVGDIYGNMARVLDRMLEQGVQAIGSFIDVDPIIKDKAIRAADKLKDNFKKDIEIKFINQVVKGVIEPQARLWFEIAAQYVDIIGGLPEKDEGREAEHLDIIFETAKRTKKPLHVHVDQYRLPSQRHTELLVDKTFEHNYQGKVTAVHCLSVAAQPKEYRRNLYKKMKQAGVMVITCPTAWINSARNEIKAPMHNSIAPVEEMVEAGLTVGLGTDNIQDIYKPFTDGDMWTELRFLMESCRFYDIKSLSEIASVNGLKTLSTAN